MSAPITVGNAPEQVAITPDGKHAYVTNNADGTVSVITTATGAVSAPITVGSRPIGVAITPDGKQVYVTNSSVDNFVTNDVAANGAGTVSVITTAHGCGVGPHHRRQRSDQHGDLPSVKRRKALDFSVPTGTWRGSDL